MKCINEDCVAEAPDHKWGKIRAQSSGWFSSEDNEHFCPIHVPDWVVAWRDRKINDR
jgi:hypothetical protein